MLAHGQEILHCCTSPGAKEYCAERCNRCSDSTLVPQKQSTLHSQALLASYRQAKRIRMVERIYFQFKDQAPRALDTSSYADPCSYHHRQFLKCTLLKNHISRSFQGLCQQILQDQHKCIENTQMQRRDGRQGLEVWL